MENKKQGNRGELRSPYGNTSEGNQVYALMSTSVAASRASLIISSPLWLSELRVRTVRDSAWIKRGSFPRKWAAVSRKYFCGEVSDGAWQRFLLVL